MQHSHDVVQVVGDALDSIRPCELKHEIGTATFAVNRRNNKEADVPKLLAAGTRPGSSSTACS